MSASIKNRRGFSQVVRIAPNGRETVLSPCLVTREAVAYVRGFNRVRLVTKSYAEVRPIALPAKFFKPVKNSQR